MAMLLLWEPRLPSMFAAAEVRRQELLAEAARDVAIARSRAGADAPTGRAALVRRRIGGALIRAGERLRADLPVRPGLPTAERDRLPAVGRSQLVGLEHRCPTCRRVVWPPPRESVGQCVVTAAEDLIRRHQRRPPA